MEDIHFIYEYHVVDSIGRCHIIANPLILGVHLENNRGLTLHNRHSAMYVLDAFS